AEKAGLQPGDVVTRIDGASLDGLTLDEARSRVCGPKGTPVVLTIERQGAAPRDVEIVRAVIISPEVESEDLADGTVGYVRLSGFSDHAAEEFDRVIAEDVEAGRTKLIVDLRGNPGGFVTAAREIASQFLADGTIFWQEDADGSLVETRAEPGGAAVDPAIRLVVLVDGGSASASEIVAGAIQDHDRGLVVGETSWGKGLVQSVYTLQYGAGLALTTSKYFTPAGRNIQRDFTSVYDYYMADEAENGAEVPLAEREQFRTATGRIVYGGGGITPDVIVKQPQLSRTTQLLEVRSAIFNYAVEYAAKHPELTKELEVTPAMIEEFVRHAAAAEIANESDIRDTLTKPEDHKYIMRALKAEIVAAKYGFDASYPYRLQGDAQVEKALEVFPEAQKLAMLAADVRSRGGESRSNEAGTRAAQANPKTR
ncbi:MAG: S41 family peptidase, partial [Thermoanaerobaculia bacterium]